MCERSLEEMGAVFDMPNVYLLHMMYQAMGVCLYMEDPEEAIRYGEQIIKSYRCVKEIMDFRWFFLFASKMIQIAVKEP